MTDSSLFEKMCQPFGNDFLPPVFPLPLQQLALSGIGSERHLTDVERTNWLSRQLLTYILHKRGSWVYPDQQVPAFLSPALVNWLNAVEDETDGLPVTRLMTLLGKHLAPYDRVYDLKKKRGVLQLYADLAGSFAITLGLPHGILPDFIYDALAAPAKLGVEATAAFPLSIAMVHLWRTQFTALPFEPASSQHVTVFLAQFLGLVLSAKADPRLMTRDFTAWLNAPHSAGKAIGLTNFMALTLRLAGVEEDARWNDPAFLKVLAQQFYTQPYPSLAVPQSLAAVHEKLAADQGIVIPPRRPDAGEENRYLWKKIPPPPRDPASRQVNLLAVDDVAKYGARLSRRLQAALAAGGTDTVFSPDTLAARRQGAPGPINLFACRMDGLADFVLRRGLSQFEGRYNIGYAAWETDRLPQGIRIGLNLLDEIWVASAYQKQLFEQEFSGPVHVLPCGMNEAPVSKNISRASLGIPEEVFLFTAAADCHDFLSRKNLLGALQAFQQAFPAEKSAALLIKTRDIGKAMSQREEGLILKLKKLWNADSRIYVVHDDLPDAEMQTLLALSDAYVSLARCSAFNATLAEAMALGKPAVATEGSGPADYLSGATGFPVKAAKASVVFEGYAFMDKEPDHGWWDPEIAGAAVAMKKIFTQREGAQKIAAEGKALVQARYNAAACGRAMAKRIAEILQSDALRQKRERAA